MEYSTGLFVLHYYNLIIRLFNNDIIQMIKLNTIMIKFRSGHGGIIGMIVENLQNH